jgi:hypothetical protein
VLSPVLADGLFGFIPWSVVALIAVVVIGIFLIRAAITIVKVVIVVAIGVAIYLGVRFLFGI